MSTVNINIQMIQEGKHETIQVRSKQGQMYNQTTIKSLQEAVTEKYGIPGEHLKFESESGTGRGSGYLSSSSNVHSSTLIRVVVDKDFCTKKSLEKEVFFGDMTKLMEDPETADFTLKTGDKSFKVHKAVLGARSSVFRTMFLSGNGMKEGVEGEAIIKDVDKETLQEVLHYLYTGSLSGKDYGINSLCYAADKYQLDTLMDLISGEAKQAELKAEDVAEVFISAEMFRKEELFKVGMDKLKKNKEMMNDVKFEEILTNAKLPKLLFKIMKIMSTWSEGYQSGMAPRPVHSDHHGHPGM